MDKNKSQKKIEKKNVQIDLLIISSIIKKEKRMVYLHETPKEFGLTSKEAAQLVGCSEYKIKEMARGKNIPFYRVGVRYMFTRSALIEWIRQQEKDNSAGGENNAEH